MKLNSDQEKTLNKIDAHPGLPLNNLLGQGQAQSADKATAKTATEAGTASNAPTSAQDRLTIDGATRVFRETEATLKNEAPVDAEKVARIRQAIADGSYKPDAERTTDSFIALENALYNK